MEQVARISQQSERAVALLAGGSEAVYRAVEGAEDDRERGAADILAARVGAQAVINFMLFSRFGENSS